MTWKTGARLPDAVTRAARWCQILRRGSSRDAGWGLARGYVVDSGGVVLAMLARRGRGCGRSDFARNLWTSLYAIW